MQVSCLDSLIVPSQASERRNRYKARFAAKRFFEIEIGVIIPSGGKTPLLNPRYEDDASLITEVLLGCGVPREKVIKENRSLDNVSNLLYSIPLSCGFEIGIVSYPSHLDRFEEIFRRGQSEGVFDRRVNLHRFDTNEVLAERVYEVFARKVTRRQLDKYGVRCANIPSGKIKILANLMMKIFSCYSSCPN